MKYYMLNTIFYKVPSNGIFEWRRPGVEGNKWMPGYGFWGPAATRGCTRISALYAQLRGVSV